MIDRNPQADQMGDASMVTNLAWQALAIWPQEQGLFDRYGLRGEIRILDVGCGTGEITRRLAERYPRARLIGVDILESNLAIARATGSPDGRVQYQQGDAFALQFPDAEFDLIVCRHVSQAVPDFPLALREITRCLRPGGWLHLLSEDYAMLRFPAGPLDPDRFWVDFPLTYLAGIGCDGRIGRHSYTLMKHAGYGELAVDYIVVDTLRVPREVFAGILRAWRDGYAEPLASATGKELALVRSHFEQFIAAIEAPDQYAVWHVPVISGRKP
jgi:ubiquinone/menaquinone biosynthesis C-methylase UbiE